MTTQDRINHCAQAGCKLAREEYYMRHETRRGWRGRPKQVAVFGYRWTVTGYVSGCRLAVGRTPAQAFKRWRLFRLRQKP